MDTRSLRSQGATDRALMSLNLRHGVMNHRLEQRHISIGGRAGGRRLKGIPMGLKVGHEAPAFPVQPVDRGDILTLHGQQMRLFGGPRYAHVETDLLGLEINRMRRRCERGEAPQEEVERAVTMRF